MKRSVFILIFILLLPSLCFGAAKPPIHKKIVVQGGYDSVASINVRPIAVQAESYKMGMPFSIDDPSVMSGNSERGRLIANWNLLTNNRFKLDIDAQIMHHFSEDEVENAPYSTGLGYILQFVYNVSYYSNGQAFYKPNLVQTIEVKDSGTTNHHYFEDVDFLGNIAMDNNSLIGNAEGDIYFCFDPDTTRELQTKNDYDLLPDGNYNAIVTIYLKVAEEVKK